MAFIGKLLRLLPTCENSIHTLFLSYRFINMMIYGGITIATAYMSGNMYLDFTLVSFVEIPANFIVIYACDRLVVFYIYHSLYWMKMKVFLLRFLQKTCSILE